MHSPVKVNDQVGDAYKQVVNSYGVRRQVGRTLCVCEGSTYMTCVKGAQGPRIKVYAKNCQTWAHDGLLLAVDGGTPGQGRAGFRPPHRSFRDDLAKRLQLGTADHQNTLTDLQNSPAPLSLCPDATSSDSSAEWLVTSTHP